MDDLEEVQEKLQTIVDVFLQELEAAGITDAQIVVPYLDTESKETFTYSAGFGNIFARAGSCYSWAKAILDSWED